MTPSAERIVELAVGILLGSLLMAFVGSLLGGTVGAMLEDAAGPAARSIVQNEPNPSNRA